MAFHFATWGNYSKSSKKKSLISEPLSPAPRDSDAINVDVAWVSGYITTPQVIQRTTKIEKHCSKMIIRIQEFTNQMTH